MLSHQYLLLATRYNCESLFHAPHVYPEQAVNTFEAMTVWTIAAQRVGADIRFVDAGDSDGLIQCKECLTLPAAKCTTGPQALCVL